MKAIIDKEAEFIERIDQVIEDSHMNSWDLYNHLKRYIDEFEVDYETGIKIIVRALKI